MAALAVGLGPVVVDRSLDRDTPDQASDGATGTDGDLTGSLPGGDDEPSPDSVPADEADPAERAGEGRGRGRRDDERPRRPPVPDLGTGTFRVATDPAEPGAGPDLTYTVEVEGGVPFAPDETATTVDRVLADERGWRTVTGQTLGRTTTDADFRVLVASPATTDLLCAPLATNGEVSCRNGDLVVLNAERWATGVPDYDGHLRQYRTYLVNHEVGHRLGYGHVECEAPGTPAPVMQQQTYGLDGCTRNAWPTTVPTS